MAAYKKCLECDKRVKCRGLCAAHYTRYHVRGTLEEHALPRAAPPEQGERRAQASGYVQVYRGTRWELEHRVLMEEQLGRRLGRGESVHHINGDRADNRPENLELWWRSPQPAGQRVQQLVQYVAQHHRHAILREIGVTLAWLNDGVVLGTTPDAEIVSASLDRAATAPRVDASTSWTTAGKDPYREPEL